MLFYRYQPKTRPPKSTDKQSCSATPPRERHIYLPKETRVIESPLIIHYEPKIGLVESNDYIYMLAQHLSVQILKSSVVLVSSEEIIFQSTNYSARTTLIGVAE